MTGRDIKEYVGVAAESLSAPRDLNITEMDFLGLARLRYLKKLVLLDPNPGPSPELLGLIREFQERTNHGVHVVNSLPGGDPTACCCYLY